MATRVKCAHCVIGHPFRPLFVVLYILASRGVSRRLSCSANWSTPCFRLSLALRSIAGDPETCPHSSVEVDRTAESKPSRATLLSTHDVDVIFERHGCHEMRADAFAEQGKICIRKRSACCDNVRLQADKVIPRAPHFLQTRRATRTFHLPSLFRLSPQSGSWETFLCAARLVRCRRAV